MGCGKCEHGKDHRKDHGHHEKGCVCEVVRAIKDIQDIGSEHDCDHCPTSCFMEPLGGLVSPGRKHKTDTRVFMLLDKQGNPFKAFFRDRDRCDDDCFSVFFRVEEIFDNCCATLRVLEPKNKSGAEVDLLDSTGTTIDLRKLCSVRRFRATNSCVTVDLSCFCGVQCVDDVFLDIC